MAQALCPHCSRPLISKVSTRCSFCGQPVAEGAPAWDEPRTGVAPDAPGPTLAPALDAGPSRTVSDGDHRMPPLPPPVPMPEKPGVIRWFHVYRHVLMAFLIVVGLGACVQTMSDKEPELRLMELAISADDPAMRDAMIREKKENMRMAMWLVAIAMPFLAAGRFVLEGTWAYRYGIATIIQGALLCIGLPAAIVLLIFWLRPEVRAYFAAQEAWRNRHSVDTAPPRGAP